MNISEANAVAALLRLLDGSYAGDLAALDDTVTYLRGRVEKPLLLTLPIDQERVRFTLIDLHRHSLNGRRLAGQSHSERSGS